MLKPIATEYLEERFEVEPGERLHRLCARLSDTWYDDLSGERIEELERKVDEWRHTHASGARFPTDN